MGEIIIKKKYKVAMVCGMILYMSSVLFAFHYEFRAPQKQAEQDIFIVSPDTSKSEVIQNLYTQGYIRKRWTFKFARLFARRDIIETGGYKLSKSMNAWKIVNTLTNDPITKWVIIPEDLREEKIAKIFAKRLNWTKKKEKRFIAAYTAAQKDYFKEETVKIFSKTFN
ncbi:endolytic transglycosylase MltG, partial [Patescibacteria group bacterium]|nr:endolytic transglycosylase MltG [Patescibacteria group bacterium]